MEGQSKGISYTLCLLIALKKMKGASAEMENENGTIIIGIILGACLGVLFVVKIAEFFTEFKSETRYYYVNCAVCMMTVNINIGSEKRVVITSVSFLLRPSAM